jgi:hypothetical protein
MKNISVITMNQDLWNLYTVMNGYTYILYVPVAKTDIQFNQRLLAINKFEAKVGSYKNVAKLQSHIKDHINHYLALSKKCMRKLKYLYSSVGSLNEKNQKHQEIFREFITKAKTHLDRIGILPINYKTFRLDDFKEKANDEKLPDLTVEGNDADK